MTFLQNLLGLLRKPRKSIATSAEDSLTTKLDKTLADILQSYTVLDVVSGNDKVPSFLVVTEKSSSDPSFINFSEPSPWYESDTYSPPVVRAEGAEKTGPVLLKEKVTFGEIASSSPSPYTGFIRKEYNQSLIGNKGLQEYNKMRSDGVISGTLLLFKTPVHSAKWFIQPYSQEPRDIAIAEFVWRCLTEYMSISWTQIKTEAMLMCEFGYYSFEKVWEKRDIDDELTEEFGKSRIVLQKLAPRHPLDVEDWKYDSHGGPKYMKIYVEDEDGGVTEKKIPISKLLVFTLNREAGNITGRSLLRSAYKHWYYKEALYKIDAIQKERHGIGIPVIVLPPNFTEQDKIAANTLGRNLRTNERAHITLPPNWDVHFAKLEGQPVNVIESIEMHDKAIRENILASFLSADMTTNEEDLGLFLKSSRFVADSICDAFNLYLIPELVRYNFGKDVKLPKLKVRRIGEQADWRVLAFAIRNLIGAGVLRPDDKLEAAMRDEMDLPIADVTTTRIVQTPQANQAQPASTPNATPGQSTPESNPEVTGQSNKINTIGKTDGTGGSVGLPRGAAVPQAKLPGGNAGNDKGGQS